MTTQVAQQTPANGGTPPPADPDTAKYAELAKELEIDEQGGEGGEPEPTPAPSEPSEPADKGKPTELDNLRTALREAREQSKAEQARTDAILAALKESRERRQQPAEPAKAAEPKIPDKLEDPIGHFEAKIARLEGWLQQAAQGNQMTAEQLQTYQQQQQQQQFQAVVVRAEEEINDPKSANYKPDYWDAVGHLETQRVKELEHMYPDNSPYAAQVAQHYGLRSVQELRQAVLNHDRQAVAVQALQMGIPPAEFYYSLALNRGYQAKAAGQQATLADRAAQQITATKKGTKAAITLSGDTGGRKGANDMSLTDLADLFVENPDMADKVWESMRKAGKLG